MRTVICAMILLAALLALLILNTALGTVRIPAADLMKALTGQGGDTYADILYTIRLPRALTAAFLGGGLALSGYLLQTYFQNPIAGPFVLGISSGAKMAVALVMVFSLYFISGISSFAQILAAFAGSLLVTGFLLLVARRIHSMASLLVAGIMIGYICNAITDIIVTFADDSDIVNLHNWSAGSFSGMNWNEVWISIAVTMVCLAFALILSKPIGALQFGEAYAASMGVRVKAVRIAIILLSSVLSATVAAFAGPISFVGVAVPFLVQGLLRTNRPLVVIPMTFLGGAVFCLGADLTARLILAPTELNISTVTAVFGAPVVIFMMVRRRSHGTS